MILCTKAGCDICRSAFGKKNVVVSNIENMIASFALDPKVTQPVKDAFIVMQQDLVNAKVMQSFTEMAAKKHSNVIIVVIVKNQQAIMNNVKGVDASLIRPRNTKELESIVSTLITERKSSKPVIDPNKDNQKIEEWRPQEVEALDGLKDKEEEKPTEQVDSLNTEVKLEQNMLLPDDDVHNSLVQRIRECEKTAEIVNVRKELTATAVLKQLADEHDQYASIEEVLRGLKEKIQSIASVTNDSNLQVNLSKIRALLRDSDYYKAKTNSVIEQYVEDIIDTIVDVSLSYVNKRLEAIDSTLVKLRISDKCMEASPVIASLLDQRANVWLELAALDKEVRTIFKITDDLAKDMVEQAAIEDTSITGISNIDARIKTYGEEARPATTLNMMVNVLKSANKASEEFEDALREIEVMSQKLALLLGTDNAAIAAMTRQYEQMKICKVEDSVIARTLLKQALRVYTGYEGAGVTAISLIISQLKSRVNSNVLLLDLSGKAKFEDYGESYINLDDFMASDVDKEFCIVSGEISQTPETLQRLLVVLNRAADYYKVINIIVAPEQIEVFNVLATEVASINYIVGTSNTEIKKMAQLIEETTFENMGQRIIINKCDVPVENIFYRLGVLDKLAINTLKIPVLPEIINASYSGVKPYLIDSVVDSFRDVIKYA